MLSVPQAQQETQKAALRYERAVSMHSAAREMVYVAEQGLLADRNTMDSTWQEMLNHATAKVCAQAYPQILVWFGLFSVTGNSTGRRCFFFFLVWRVVPEMTIMGTIK